MMSLMSFRTVSVRLLAPLLILVPTIAFAAKDSAAKPFVVQGDPKTIGNPAAPQGGTFNIVLGQEPATLNPITGTDLYNQTISGYILDSLMERDAETYEWMPALAEKSEQSADGKTITFFLRKDVKFSDGKPVTAADVKFSFDVVFDNKYNAAHKRPYYENIEKAEVIDPYTVRFTVKEKYFGNYEVVAGMGILPKHVYENADEGKKKNKTIIGSGPYKLETYEQGQYLTLVKNKDWYGAKLEHNKGRWNFEHLRMRFIKDENIILERIKKGEIDLYDDILPDTYEKLAVGPEWGKIAFKVKTENLSPKDYGYIGWNLRKELFQDKEVRLALAMLVNRPEMIKKFRYDLSLPATGPWYLQSEYADPSVKPVAFDPKKASEILKKAGWKLSDQGVLEKTVNGKKQEFRFTLNYGRKDTEKYWVLYQNDLKKVGIDMKLQLLEWNALLKKIDDSVDPANSIDKGFDAITLRWGGGSVDMDPKQIWHSLSASKSGSNFISYKNPEVDKFIDEARQELDKKKRVKLLRNVYSKIAADYPYAFLFNDKYVLYLHSSKVKMVKPTYKFAIGTDYWWAANP
jgi:microcin C transport system substrate-binding protein